jgi:elongin-A
LSTKACIKNIRSKLGPVQPHHNLLTWIGLTDVGDFEYWKIRPILQRVDSPEQLHQIELNSPQILGEDAELWRTFISKHIPNWEKKNYVPKNHHKWYEVYCKYKKEQQQEIARDEEILRNAMMGLQAHKATHVSKVVDLKSVKVPKDPRMIANNGGVPLKGRGAPRAQPSGLVWSGGSKTKMTDGKSVLTKAKREAKEISMRSKLATPTHQLSGRRNQISKAPASLVDQYRIASQPALKILSSRPRLSTSIRGSVSGPSMEEREAKLRAYTMSSGGAKATMVGSSDDDDLLQDGDDLLAGDDDTDDLFDDEPKASPRPAASRPINRPSQHSSLASQSVIKSSPPPGRTGTGTSAPMKAMMPRKRAPVDVFNRGAKKPRSK